MDDRNDNTGSEDETRLSEDRSELRTTTGGISAGMPGREPGFVEGQEFGPYRMRGRLGGGGFGEVWEAESVQTGRRLALKVLARMADPSSQAFQRFEREGRLAASLDHPRTVYIFGAEQIQGYPAITMELMSGGTLQDRVDGEGPVPTRQAVDWVLDILEGLQAAHALGILHRDLKPSNCFIDADGRARLGDFGISRSLSESSDLTGTGSFIGTPVYSSPEQIRGRDVDQRSDFYSLGATLYTLLSGRSPFGGTNAGEVLGRIMSEPPDPLSSGQLGLDPGLVSVIERLMAKEPDKRYATHDALRSALLPWSSRGLSAGGLARRFGAGAIDTVFLVLIGSPLTYFTLGHEPLSRPWLMMSLLGTVAPILYYALSEGRWGRTLGKRLLGLRVATVAGAPAAQRRVTVRTLVYVFVWMTVPFPGMMAYFGFREEILASGDLVNTAAGWFLMLNGWLGLVVLMSTARRRNGYAGIHELVSGTRVHAFVGESPRQAPADLASTGEPITPEQQIGPYRADRLLWAGAAGDRLILGFDPSLGRAVWIHHYRDQAQAPAMAQLTAMRAGRLRWLQGRRGAAQAWDAFEAPSGQPLDSWVTSRGGLGWSTTCEIVADVGLGLALDPDEARRGLTRQQVWIDGRGLVKRMPFQWPQPEPATTHDPDDWAGLLRELTWFCLDGRSPGEGGTALPEVPFPEHARPLLERLSGVGSRFESLEQLNDELARTRRRRSGIAGARRLSLAIIALASLVPLAFFLIGMLVMTLAPAWFGVIAMAPANIPRIERESAELSENERGRLDRAMKIVLADGYRQACKTPTGRAMADSTQRRFRELMVAAAEQYPNTPPDVVAEARQVLGERLGDPMRRAARRMPRLAPGISMVWLAMLAVPAVLFGALLRRGALHVLCGLSVQRINGERVSFLRGLARSLVAWSPFLLVWPVLIIFDTSLTLSIVVMSAGLIAWVHALLRPRRAICDLIVGTRIVHR